MILPNNGKVVIIDDKPADVIELISALSKEKIPFVHYKEEDLSDLPDTPIENVRLIFLDLELVTDVYLPEKNITSPIKSRLMRVIKPKTAYALVIWSKVESKYKEALLRDFETEFSDYKPIFHTSLPKATIVGQTNAIEIIKKELEAEISKFKSFNAFLVWESIVNESSGKLTNEITSLYPPDLNWDDKTKFLLYKLAIAYSGKATNSFSDITQLKNALFTLTMTFADQIESSINSLIDARFSGLISKVPQKIENFTSVMNKLLLLSETNNGSTQPGNLFFSALEFENSRQKIEEAHVTKKQGVGNIPAEKREEVAASLEKSYKKEITILEEKNNQRKSDFNEMAVSGLTEETFKNDTLKREILDSSIGVELNITPLCDYAQEKAKLFRLQPGVLIKAKYRDLLNTKSSFAYISDADFRINDEDYLFLFDFRYLYSISKKVIHDRIPKYRIKQQLLSDIQVKLGSHINRSGVLYIS